MADGWIFGHDGTHWSPSYITHSFRQLIRDAGLPPIRFHDLRHTARPACPWPPQALLGHESIVLTADTYTSVLPCLAHHAAEAAAELIRRAGR